MTDPKKPPPSMRIAAATMKMTKAELDDLLKAAENAKDEASAEDEAEDVPAAPKKKAPAPKKKAKTKK